MNDGGDVIFTFDTHAGEIRNVVSRSAECPKTPSDWTWQNVATTGIFLVCLAYMFAALCRAMMR